MKKFEKIMNLKKFFNIEMQETEPYVYIPSEKDIDKFSKEEIITINQSRRQRDKFKFYIDAFDYLNNTNLTGDYFEFGCHRARTFRMALSSAKFHNSKINYFRAFDSFEGMPDIGKEIIKNWNSGMLSTNEKDFLELINSSNLQNNKIILHKGFYEDSLNSSLINEFKNNNILASLITIDCDLYESALTALEFSEFFLQHGTLIYLDDYFAVFTKNSNGGVKNAFHEYTKRSKYNFIEHTSIGWWGKSFLVEEK